MGGKILKLNVDESDHFNNNQRFDKINKKSIYKNDKMKQNEINKLPAKNFFIVPSHLDVYKALDGNWYERESQNLVLKAGIYNNGTLQLKDDGRFYKKKSNGVWYEIL